jgi:hypothetical protein
LQHQGDRPVRAGRPSLLSPDEQAAPERQGILSSLDGMQAPGGAAPISRPRSRTLAWGGAAAGALVVVAALFLASAGDERQTPFRSSATPAVALAAASADAPRPTPVALPAPVTPAPAPAVLRDEPAATLANPLADMAPPTAPVADVREPVTRAPAGHKAHDAKVERKEARARRKERDGTHEKSKTRLAERHPKARTVHEPDNDVVLLAALVSHIEPKKGKATPAEQLEACRRYNAAGEAQCRARVCGTAGRKEAACKDVQARRTDRLTADD